MNKKEKLDQISKRLSNIETRLGELENGLSWLISYELRKDNPISPPPYNPNYPGVGQTKCPKCGIVLDQVMSYTCMYNDCPAGLGPTMC